MKPLLSDAAYRRIDREVAKYPADQSPEYKNRFLCMEGCYAAYALVSPHHNIARYCMQAACDTKSISTDVHQVLSL